MDWGLCKLRLSTERTSLTNLRASSTGSKHRRAVSRESENHDRIGIALSVGIKIKMDKHQNKR